MDLLLELGGHVHLVEIKLSSTPSSRHGAPIRKLADLLGDRAGERLVVCRVAERTLLPGGVVALPWHEWSGWLKQHL